MGYQTRDGSNPVLDGANSGTNPGDPNFKLPDGKKAQGLNVDQYNAEIDARNYLQKQDVSSLDKKDFLDSVNAGNKTNQDLGWNVSTADIALGNAQGELQNAVNNPNAPKYRYRKYLDSITNLQNDQPGQLQTVLSRGTNGGSLGFNNGSILGGGNL